MIHHELANPSVTLAEINNLHKGFSKYAHEDGTINKQDFKKVIIIGCASYLLWLEALENHVSSWSSGAQYIFLERLFDAFDLNGDKHIDFNEFIHGLSIFFKGTEDEKQECKHC